jgi:RNA-directed DNA polymerase
VDDMTFSADEKFMRGKSCNWLIRYIKGIIRDEKFTWNGTKKKIIRPGQRQIVTGLTVNQKPNVSRKEFDRLKAILNNCARKGPAEQNRDKRDNFQSYLRGKIAFVAGINPEKALRLQKIFDKIKWPAYP